MSKDEAFLRRLLSTFKAEAAEHIATISSGILELEKNRDSRRRAELIEIVFRDAHSLKGAARTVNVPAVETLCRSMESIFSVLKKQDGGPPPDVIELLYRALGLLRDLLDSLNEVGAAPDKASVKDLALRLDRAARDLENETLATPGPDAFDEPPSRAAPSRSTQPLGSLFGATIRVEKAKLDDLLLQAEGLLQAKQLAGERSSELREILAAFEGTEKRSTVARSDARVVGRFLKQQLGPAETGIAASLVRLLEFIESARDQIRELHRRLRSVEQRTQSDRRSLAVMVDSLLEGAKRISMTPFSTLFEVLPEMVRNLLAEQGKKAELILSGGEVEVDRRILEEMKDPLVHLVRNCIDHGLEKAGDRILGGKAPAGRLSVSVSHRDSGKVELAVADDGSGIDVARVRASAVRLGIISSEESERLDEDRVRSLVFRSGVSTSPLVTDISGRGLGLAIVQEKAEKLGGAVSCESSTESGTLFRVLLPVTLAAIRGLLVRTAEQLFVIPATQIRRTLRVPLGEIRAVEGRETISIDDAAVPLVPLSRLLQLSTSGKRQEPSDFVYAAVLESEEKVIAFTVDELLYEQEFLLKGLGRQLRRVRNVMGATVLGPGEVVTVLNVPDLVKSAIADGETVPSVVPPSHESATRKSLLVVEDSVTARTLLKSILETAGYDVRTANDGLDAYVLLKAEPFDLVVSDVDMPRMNGFELAARIRSDRTLGDLPIVLVTALDSKADRERGIEIGANAYVVKSSFDQSNLLEVIKKLI